MLEGHCLCRAIRFRVDAQPVGASVCHCSQCRRQSGHLWASAQAPVDAVSISGEPRWFESSPGARRGFCPSCGSFLFWKAHDEDMLSFSLGALVPPTGLKLEKQIFVSDKGDYYAIPDIPPAVP